MNSPNPPCDQEFPILVISGRDSSGESMQRSSTRKQRRSFSDEGSRPPVQRRKTGCMTCRRRKKRCDERKPVCGNCERANFECEPCPAKKPCPSGKPKGRMAKSSKQTHISNTTSTPCYPIDGGPRIATASESWPSFTAGMTTTTSALSPICFTPHQISAGLSSDGYYEISYLQGAGKQNMLKSRPFSTLGIVGETFCTPLTGPQQSHSFFDIGPGHFPGGIIGYDQTFSPSGVSSLNTATVQQLATVVSPSPLQTTLAFPIPGVDTPIRQQMFYHFHTVMANVLTTNTGSSNPMNDVIIPLALEDQIIMDTLLGLSGCHMLNIEPGHVDSVLHAEKQRLHTQALHLQVRRTEQLLATDSSFNGNSSRHRERIFANWLLLCLHEIAEGNSDSSSQKYLDMARRVITSKDQNDSSSEAIASQMHPFLIEFFLYHICLALVTMPDFLDSQDSIDNLTALLSQDKSMVGVIERLLDFIKRIAVVRQQVNREGSLSGTTIINAFSIHRDLERWTPQSPLSEDQVNLAEFYRKGLSIWLFSIVRPFEKGHYQIQDIVREITVKMSTIPDSIKACLLFPLFIVGGAAISQEDRDVVAMLFTELRSWSSLGNVDLTFKVVQNMWRDYDEGVPQAWDWTMQLEKQSMRLLVT